jgi:hypothetical protein
MEKYIKHVTSLAPGQRYRIVYMSGTQRFPRVAVMDYLSYDANHDALVFSARPAAGTQDMPRDWVKQFEVVPKTTENFVGKRFGGRLL